MKYQQDGNTVFVVVDKGEDVFSSLYKVQEEIGFTGAQVKGIGALKNTEIGFYNCDDKNYDRVILEDEKELLSMDGNFTFNEGSPFFHLHVVLGNEDYSTSGGHLFCATVAVTLEVYLQINNLKVERRPNEEIGLNLCEL